MSLFGLVLLLALAATGYYLIPRWYGQLKEMIREYEELQQLHIDNNFRIQAFKRTLTANWTSERKRTDKALLQLKVDNPPTLWQEFESRLGQLETESHQCLEELAAAENLYKIGWRKAVSLKDLLTAISKRMHRIKTLPVEAEKRIDDIREAREKSGELLALVQELRGRVQQLVEHEDVKASTKDVWVRAQRTLRTAEGYIDQKPVNWPSVYRVLLISNHLLKEAVTAVEEDKTEAEDRRRRQRSFRATTHTAHK